MLGYLISEGFRNVFKNKKSTVASLVIMCATMFIFGIFFAIGENVNHMIEDIERQQGMQVFIKNDDTITQEQKTKLGEQIRNLDGVNTVVFRTRDESLNQIKDSIFKDKPEMVEMYEGDRNPLQDSYVVTLTDLEKSEQVKNAIEKMLDLEEQNNEIIMVINTNKDDNKKMRSDPVLIAAQILELLDLTSYTFERGNSLEFFVRVNSEYLIQKVLDNHLYKSKTLATIQKLHHDSVRYMSYFFTKLESDDERWQFIEDYFLGRVENKYKIGDTNLNIKKMDVQLEKIRNDNNTYKSQIIDEVKLYELYSEDQNENLKLYIYDTKIEELEEMEYMKISPEALVAKKLIDCKQGDDFSINDFNYLIMKIDNYELKNEIKIDE